MHTPSFVSHITSPKPSWITRFARFGLLAKGIVYCLIGFLTFMAAFEINGHSTRESGKSGIFQFVLTQPLGKFLLALIAFGLLCYSLWRFIQAFFDTENKGDKATGIGRRIGYFFSGLVYGALAFTAASLVLGSGNSSGNENSQQTVAHEVLDLPFGQWLLGIISLVTILLGFNQIYQAISGKYKKKIQSGGFGNEAKNMLIRAGKIGYIARGSVWILIGYLLLKAAYYAKASEAGGTEKAFKFLESTTYGSILLGAMAIGLIAYGVFMFMRARYETIKT